MSEAEARAFVMAYPKSRLEWNVTTVCEPLLGNYNDFQLGSWPDSMVVKVVMDGPRENWTWFIRTDL